MIDNLGMFIPELYLQTHFHKSYCKIRYNYGGCWLFLVDIDNRYIILKENGIHIALNIHEFFSPI